MKNPLRSEDGSLPLRREDEKKNYSASSEVSRGSSSAYGAEPTSSFVQSPEELLDLSSDACTPQEFALIEALLQFQGSLEPQAEARAADLWEDPLPSTTPQKSASPKALKTAVGSCVDALTKTSSLAAKASIYWHQVAGEVAAKHTRGVFFKEPTVQESGALKGRSHKKNIKRAGVLYVYVDSPVFVYEYTTDHELFEERLAYLGFPVDHIEFKLSSKPAVPGGWGEAQPPLPVELAALPALPHEQESWCEELVDPLPPDLAKAAYRALSSTLRRHMSE